MLSIGHLSRRGGGDVDRHASHESGRDADVGFYITNQQDKPIYADHFVRFLGDGTAPTWPGARFDDARNWAFIASIVTDGRARVSYVFVASPLRARLLTYAQRIGAPYATRVRASELPWHNRAVRCRTTTTSTSGSRVQRSWKLVSSSRPGTWRAPISRVSGRTGRPRFRPR